ncbi:MAG: hypothetical protein AB7T49_20330 [Oligoflexales bacterium]
MPQGIAKALYYSSQVPKFIPKPRLFLFQEGHTHVFVLEILVNYVLNHSSLIEILFSPVYYQFVEILTWDPLFLSLVVIIGISPTLGGIPMIAAAILGHQNAGQKKSVVFRSSGMPVLHGREDRVHTRGGHFINDYTVGVIPPNHSVLIL